jgi:F-type H+-transporting ATPase subunit epsilon
MYLEIISPEATLYKGEVTSISIPGTNGSFQVLNNHAPTVSTLISGIAKIEGDLTIAVKYQSFFSKKGKDTLLTLTNGGTFEVNSNKAILFVD